MVGNDLKHWLKLYSVIMEESEKVNYPILLGMSNKAARRGFGWNILGASHTVFFPFLPQKLNGLYLLVGVNKDIFYSGKGYKFKIELIDDSDPENKGWVNQELGIIKAGGDDHASMQGAPNIIGASASDRDWLTSFNISMSLNNADEPGAYEILPTPAPPLIITKPTSISVVVQWEDKTYKLGKIYCGIVEPQPISKAERLAIASRPGAAKALVLVVSCEKCNDKQRIYTLLDKDDYPSEKLEKDAVYIDNAPDTWICKCKKTKMDLTFIKKGVHDLFRRSGGIEQDASFTPLYERGQLANLCYDYQELINSNTGEEKVQVFIENNPIFWSFLSPTRIIHKPPILTKKKADFAILNAQKILYIVEIEKPQTSLFTKKGGLHSEVQKGVDQIRDWNLVISDHRIAFLRELDIKEDEVHEIRFILIAGLAHKTDTECLMKLQRSAPVQNTQFYCFDELASFVHNLESQLSTI